MSVGQSEHHNPTPRSAGQTQGLRYCTGMEVLQPWRDLWFGRDADVPEKTG